MYPTNPYECNTTTTPCRTRHAQVGLKLENEGMADSVIESVWVEDEYNLFRGFSPFAPVVHSPGVRYHVAPNTTVFADALAHHVPFDQHFVASCVPDATDVRWVNFFLGPSIRRGSSHHLNRSLSLTPPHRCP